MSGEGEFQDFPVFKGLQKPLEFWGFRGRYIWWVLGSIGIAIVTFILGQVFFGIIAGLILCVISLGVGAGMVQLRQKKGLHTKKVPKGIFIIYKRREF